MTPRDVLGLVVGWETGIWFLSTIILVYKGSIGEAIGCSLLNVFVWWRYVTYLHRERDGSRS